MNDGRESEQEACSTAGLRLGEGGRYVGQITAQLRDAIRSGFYVNGDQLPAERELAERFDVARSTIRKVLLNLETDGLIKRRVGSGTFVKCDDMSIVAAHDIVSRVSPLELIEARMAVEPHMTRLAVLNATANEIKMLGSILGDLEQCRNDKEAFSRHDSMFHEWLARISKNPLLLHLYQQISAVRGHDQWDAMKNKILSQDEIDEYNRQHRALFEAIGRRDPVAAVKHITDHLEKARHDLMGAAAVYTSGANF